LAEELKAKFGVTPKLIPGSGGIFEVIADGKKVFEKKDKGRFPEAGEVSKVIGQ
jgi:selenoprotein W-related protein